jgi:hypothetical protein
MDAIEIVVFLAVSILLLVVLVLILWPEGARQNRNKLSEVQMKIKYSSNNSGGSWWLNDKQWLALEAAGWKVRWIKDDTSGVHAREGTIIERWLGALATTAFREGLSLEEAIEEWERVTGEGAAEEGCACCGRPHYFEEA